jgi:hypothetical protein
MEMKLTAGISRKRVSVDGESSEVQGCSSYVPVFHKM